MEIKENVNIKKAILEYFGIKKTWYRKELINACVTKFNLSNEELLDKTYNSRFTKIKSYIGSVISKMISSGEIYLTEGKVLLLQKDIQVILHTDEISDYIGDVLTKYHSLTKKEIISYCEIHFKTNITTTLDDDIELRDIIEKTLITKTKSNILLKTNNYYSLNQNTTYPNTVLGNLIKSSEEKENIFNDFVAILNEKGGEFFEAFSVKVLEEYYKYSKHTVLKANVTGGSLDNGIDGILEVTNSINHHQTILMQAKVRATAQVTLKEVREFYGALNCEKGDFGIFMTTSTYHKEALRFISKTKNMVGVDNRILFDLAKVCHVGIIEKNGKLSLDANVFLNDKF